MAIFDFLKKEPEKKPKKKTAPKKEAPKAVKKEEIKPAIAKKKAKTVNALVLESPHVTEKATDLTAENKYIFKVIKDSNKIEIRNAVESNYGVKVESVRIINVPRRKKRIGRTIGWKKGYKKAIVEVKKGQTIEILPR